MSSVGYATLQIIPSLDGIDKAITKGVSGARANTATEKAGKGVGRRLVGAIKTGGLAVAATGAAALGVALTKGWSRLQGLEEANKAFEGMGLGAGDVKTQMDGLNNVLTGTPYALDQGASALAGLVAAGVPLNKTERMMNRIADAAAFGQAPLNEVASVFTDIARNGKVSNRELRMLADKNIPIYGMLADTMGITGDEVRKLAEKGELSADEFSAAWDAAAAGFGENGIVIEGAAKNAGDTVRGAWGNAMAAMGRLGATVLGPIYERLPDIIKAVTTKINELKDRVAPMVEAFMASDKVKGFFDGIATAISNIDIGAVIDKLVGFGEKIRDLAEEWLPKLKDKFSELFSGDGERVQGIFSNLADVARDLGPSLKDIATSIGMAVAATGVGTWQLLLDAMGPLTDILSIVLVPALETLAGLMRDNQEVVGILVAGYLGFKAVEKPLGAVKTAVDGIKSGMDSVKSFGDKISNAGEKVKDFFSAGGGMDDLRLRLMDAGDMAKDASKKIGKGISAVKDYGGAAFTSAGQIAADTAAKGWNAIKTGVMSAATGLATGVQAAFNAVMALNPVVLVVIAIAALIAILVIAYNKVGWFRDLVDAAFGLIKDVVSGVFNWVKDNWPLLLAILTGPIGLAVLAITKNWDKIKEAFTAVKDWISKRVGDIVGFITGIPGRIRDTVSTMWDGIKTAFTTVKDWLSEKIDDVVTTVTGLPGRITTAARGMWDGIKEAFKSALNWVIRKWNSLSFTLPSLDLGPLGKVGGWTVSVPKIPEFHAGGTVDGRYSGDEVVARLLRDETVLTPAQIAKLGAAAGGRNVTVVNRFNGPVAGRSGERWVTAMTTSAARKGLMTA